MKNNTIVYVARASNSKRLWRMISIVACCHSAKHCTHAARVSDRNITIPCNIYIYIEIDIYIYIYRAFQFIVFLTLSNLNQISNLAVTHTYKMHENRCVLLESDMHVRPMPFTVLCTPTDSSDKTQMMCSAILLCLFVP